MENRSFTQNTDPNINQNNGQLPPPPNNNMVLAIVATVLSPCSFCCIGLVLGIVAIVFANQVNTKYSLGDYIGAEQTAKNVKILSLIAIGLAVITIIYSIVQVILVGPEAYMETYQQYLDMLNNQ